MRLIIIIIIIIIIITWFVELFLPILRLECNFWEN